MSLLDFLKPRLLEEFTSSYSGVIRIYEQGGDRYITTGNLTQSGSIVRDVWQKTLSGLSRPQGKSWLILGLAGGTLAKYISAKNHPHEIIGVEIDPIMVEIGKKYFGLNQLSELKIVTSDASAYLKKTPGQFDCILVDMYFGDIPPDFIYSIGFVNQLIAHTKPGGTVVFNHLFYDEPKRQSAQKLVGLLKKYFSEIKLRRQLTNLLISATV